MNLWIDRFNTKSGVWITMQKPNVNNELKIKNKQQIH